MRILGAAVAGLVLLLLAAPASGDNSPQWQFHDGVEALKVLKKNVGGALQLERSAEALAKAGELPEAKSELKNSVKLLKASTPAAEWMTDPFREPKDPWSTFSTKLDDVTITDLDAIAADRKAGVETLIAMALAEKTAVYKLVTRELSALTCGVLVNDQGPVTVNGVAQGEEQVSVDVACREAIKDIKIEFPSTVIAQAQPDNGTETLKQGGKVADEKPAAGAKKEGETLVTQDPVSGERIEIIVIHGDSVDYVDEVM